MGMRCCFGIGHRSAPAERSAILRARGGPPRPRSARSDFFAVPRLSRPRRPGAGRACLRRERPRPRSDARPRLARARFRQHAFESVADRLRGRVPGVAGDARLHRFPACRRLGRRFVDASSASWMNASGVAAIATRSPNIALTSWIGVETTGLPAAMYSSVLVGLMKRGRLVERERHQADIPAGDELRQDGRRAAGRASACWDAAATSPDRSSRPARPSRSARPDRRRRARATRSRSRRSSMTPKKPRRGRAIRPCSASARRIGRRVAGGSRRRVVVGVDGARQAEHVRVAAALGLVEARAAGEHQVGALQQRGLALAHLARRVLERRQLVHAVVDDGSRLRGRPAAAAPSACRTRPRSRRSLRRRDSSRSAAAAPRAGRHGSRAPRPPCAGAAPRRRAPVSSARAGPDHSHEPAPRRRRRGSGARGATAGAGGAGTRSPSADGKRRSGGACCWLGGKGGGTSATGVPRIVRRAQRRSTRRHDELAVRSRNALSASSRVGIRRARSLASTP